MRALLALLALLPLAAAERVNHAGRALGRLPAVKAPLLFNTPQADAVLAAMQIMPLDSPWNEDVSARPLLAESAAIIARIRADLGQRGTLRVFPEMNFVLVPDDQPLVPLRFTVNPEESDYHGGRAPVATWPIPTQMPVECWPLGRPAGETLAAWQRDAGKAGGDRHTIVVQPSRMRCFETWQGRLGEQGWEASNGAIFDLASNATRPDGWTSGDAAGLPMFPALIRWDEVERGAIEHALRIVVRKTRRTCLWPATHVASKETDASLPAMGQRLRLQAAFAIPAGWSKQSKAVAQALKTYGALVADHGGFLSVSATPDDRWPEGCFREVESIPIERFEVVQGTGPQERPSPRPRRRR